MDLVFVATVNIAVFVGLLCWEYVQVVNKKERFYTRIASPSQKKLPKTLLFLPSSLFYQAENVLSRLQKKSSVKKNLAEEFTLPKLLILNAAVLLLSFNFATLLKIPWYVTFSLGLLGQVLLYFYTRGKKQKLKDEMEKKLPEILDVMARVYRVHTDLRVTFQEVANTIHEPLLQEKFSEMVRLSRFGYTIEEAMEHVAKEISSEDFDFIVTSIKLNIPVGGDLSHLFEHTAKLLRQRKEAKNEIQNLMFQSKISSIISALLVPAIILVAFTSSQKYQQVLLYNPTGRLVFFACLFWWIIGVVLIRKNSRIRI